MTQRTPSLLDRYISRPHTEAEWDRYHHRRHRQPTGSSVRCVLCGQKINDLIAAILLHGKPVHRNCPSDRLIHVKRSGQYEIIDRRRVFERDGWRCGICKRRIDRRLSHPHPKSAVVDHVIPIKLGGSHTYVNVQAAHWKCNATKGYSGYGDQLALIG